MKALLILSEMPENCKECPFIQDKILCGVRGYQSNESDKRPEWCPLKEMPEHITFDDMNKNPVLKLNEGYVYGWNQALDVIEGTED